MIFPIVSCEPLDRFASNFDRGTRQYHGHVFENLSCVSGFTFIGKNRYAEKIYIYGYMLDKAGKTAGPNRLKLFEGTHQCPGTKTKNKNKILNFFEIPQATPGTLASIIYN